MEALPRERCWMCKGKHVPVPDRRAHKAVEKLVCKYKVMMQVSVVISTRARGS